MLRTPLAAIILLALSGCWSITPPPKPQNPATIYVTNYGYHSSLILPVEPGKAIEYVFGDWNYMAESHKSVLDALGALLVSQRSAFGRRYVQVDPAMNPPARELSGARYSAIEVERSKLDVVLRELDDRYHRSATTQPLRNSDSGLDCVIDAEHYSLVHNCNTMTAQLLGRLDAKVCGVVVLSKWCVRRVPTTQSSHR